MADKICPLMSGPCIEHKCRWYIQLLGMHPQTGETMDKWGCAVEFTPVLLIENAKETRQYAAAVESMRNEARRDTTTMVAAVAEMAQRARAAEREVAPSLPVWQRLLGRS